MIWTNPPNIDLNNYLPYQTGQQISQPNPAEWEQNPTKPKIAILFAQADDFISQEWYKLTANFAPKTVANLGFVQGGAESWEETLQELKKNNTFAIIVHSPPLERAFWDNQQSKITVIDSHLQFQNSIFPPKGANIQTWLAHQSYYTEPLALEMLENQNVDLLRLGQLKADISQVEPLIRESNQLIINPRAVRAADMPLSNQPNPNGLAAAEICRILRYAAINEHLDTAIIQDFSYKNQQEAQTAHLLAQMIWFLIEGFFARKGDYPLNLEKLQHYSLSIQNWDEPLHFFKSKYSERWWVAVPALMDIEAPTACLRPCAYKDYEQASKGELSERLWNYLAL